MNKGAVLDLVQSLWPLFRERIPSDGPMLEACEMVEQFYRTATDAAIERCAGLVAARVVALREAEQGVEQRQGGKVGDGYSIGFAADELDTQAAALRELKGKP